MRVVKRESAYSPVAGLIDVLSTGTLILFDMY